MSPVVASIPVGLIIWGSALVAVAETGNVRVYGELVPEFNGGQPWFAGAPFGEQSSAAE